MKSKTINLFKGAVKISEERYPNLYPMAQEQPERLEKHLVGLAKISYNTEEPTQIQLQSVATFMEMDL
jgi:hypothetical protein